jgi:hypothetical protein
MLTEDIRLELLTRCVGLCDVTQSINIFYNINISPKKKYIIYNII